MNDDHHPTPPDHCALDLGDHDAPHQQADARVVHGLLRMLDEGEPTRVASRIDRATAAVRSLEGGIRLVGTTVGTRVGTRRRTVRETLAWIGGSAGMAAAIALALLLFPSSTEATALAALNSMRSAARTGGRCYDILVMPNRDAAIAAERGRGDAPERGRGDGLRRVGELRLGAEGRWTLTLVKPRGHPSDPPPPGGRPPLERVVMGFDGNQYWVVGPRGTIRRSDSQRALGRAFPGLVEAGILDSPMDETDGDRVSEPTSFETLGYLSLSSVLDSLQRGYTVSFDSRTDAENSLDRPITVVQARRTDSQADGAPQSVRLVADSTTLEVISVRMTWGNDLPQGPNPANRPPLPGQSPRAVLIRQMPRGACEEADPQWFSPDFHRSNSDDSAQRPR